MDLSPEREAELGEDLSVLVRAIPAPLIQLTPLSHRGPAQRATAFRLHFADGRTCKGALLETAQQAEQAAAVAGKLGHCGIPAVMGQHGSALLAQWIDGEPLAGGDCTVDTLRHCGAIQGLAHTAAVADHAREQPAAVLYRRQRNLGRDLAALVECALLDHGHAQRADDIAGRLAPASCTIAPIFGDFCAENIVRTSSGELFVVDIETLSIDACEYDLARTWYRWPMTAAERAAYWDGYRTHREPDAFLAHLPFWAILALVDGAIFRQRYRPTTTSVPIARLCGLIEKLEHGVTTADAMTW